MNCQEINSNSEIVLKAPKRPSEMRFNNANKKEITKINLDFCKERKEKYCDYKTNEICPTNKNLSFFSKIISLKTSSEQSINKSISPPFKLV